MASLPLPAWSNQVIPLAAPPRMQVSVEAASQLSAFEWSIVAMAERDSLASLRKPTKFWTMISLIFGLKPANRLANDRLEALRRVAVLAWRYRWNVPTSELESFFTAGYSPAQYELLQRRVADVRTAQRRRTKR